MTRRELLTLAAGAPLLRGAIAAQSVSIGRCSSYDEDLPTILKRMFDQIGGAGRLVTNKTITIKLNLTGSPGLRFEGKPLGSTHYSHPKTIGAMVKVLGDAGAKRIRLVESCWGTAGPLEEYMLDCGWNVRALQSSAARVEFENTNALGTTKQYAKLMVPGGGLIYPAYMLNRAYENTDVFMSMAKLKNHATCGVTLSMKNCFGITPASIYGDDAGVHEPNENPASGRVHTCHEGKRQPATAAPGERNPGSSREPGYRMPRITAELNAARPVNIAFIDGVETVSGGEGPWVRGLRAIRPGVMLLGTNATATDTVAAALMGYNPRSNRGTEPFKTCDNTLLLAESLGVGPADLNRIDVCGLSIKQAGYSFLS